MIFAATHKQVLAGRKTTDQERTAPMDAPVIPSELVEAAAVVCYSLAPEHDTSTYPHGYVPYDEARPSSRENARADALEVLTALYPLIEQRVIDRLAREADDDAVHISSLADPRIALCGGQKKRSMADFASPSPDKWEGCWTCLAEKRAIDERVACGVAAERARTAKLREALRILSDPDDPPFADWAFFHRAEDREEASQEFARAALAALAPERTTEPVTDGEPVTDEEAGS